MWLWLPGGEAAQRQAGGRAEGREGRELHTAQLIVWKEAERSGQALPLHRLTPCLHSWTTARCSYKELPLKAAQKFQNWPRMDCTSWPFASGCNSRCQLPTNPSWHRVCLVEGPLPPIISAHWFNFGQVGMLQVLLIKWCHPWRPWKYASTEAFPPVVGSPHPAIVSKGLEDLVFVPGLW